MGVHHPNCLSSLSFAITLTFLAQAEHQTLTEHHLMTAARVTALEVGSKA